MQKVPVKEKNKKSRNRFWLRITSILLVLPLLLFSVALAFVYVKQDEFVQKLITQANQDFEGAIKIGNSHIEPFSAFPFISIDFEDFHIYEGKTQRRRPKSCISNIVMLVSISGMYSVMMLKLKG